MNELATVENVLAQLNTGKCCDFEVDSSKQYELQIRVPPGTRLANKEWLIFTCNNSTWSHSKQSNRFAPWSTQLVPCGQGKVEQTDGNDPAVGGA